ncbi:hypothetical protein TRIUR3_28548 [Triticum urartu]|uniref:Uncharacterized protein n=1 Tax=Triticum urartu TaxID=4572 RepID=M7ZHS8_TRIUA|nr:hypothetical protein TRIUR3_28548 [Triticum urartu]
MQQQKQNSSSSEEAGGSWSRSGVVVLRSMVRIGEAEGIQGSSASTGTSGRSRRQGRVGELEGRGSQVAVEVSGHGNGTLLVDDQ